MEKQKSKWEKVAEWVQDKEFAIKDFEAIFGPYPNTAGNYLSMMVRKGLVKRVARGKYKGSNFPVEKFSSSVMIRRKYKVQNA